MQLKEKERIAAVRQRAHDEVQTLRNKIEQTQDKIDAFDEERGSESELKKTKDNFEDNFQRVKKELYDMQQQQKEKPQKEVHKQRRIIASKEKERNALEERLNSTKPLDDLREQESELEAVINDKNALPSDKEAALSQSS